MEQVKVIAFTHKNFPLEEIGLLHLNDDVCMDKLHELKTSFHIDELLYLSTCNRVEFILCTEKEINQNFLQEFFTLFNSKWSNKTRQLIVDKAAVFSGQEAIRHIFEVASSVDSMVIGEREIITQVRTAFEKCKNWGLTGDTIRLIIRKTIESAKQVYTETEISSKPVSVVSLAYMALKKFDLPKNPRILMIGAGITNQNMSRFLKKHGFGSFSVFNRTLSKAEKLAKDLEGKAYELNKLSEHREDFDIIITCTGASEPIITPNLYKKIGAEKGAKKIIIDLAVPFDTHEEVAKKSHYISIEDLKQVSLKNQKERSKELEKATRIIDYNMEEFDIMYRTRKLELMMRSVPEKVKEIKVTAMSSVFAKDLSKLDKESLDVLEKVINYMEKKYVSVPMKMAKEILIKE